MIIIDEIQQDFEIQYATFFNDDEGSFNLVSTIQDENAFNLLEGNTGFIRVSKFGVLMELEILFVKPIIIQEMDIKKPDKTIFGIPRINSLSFKNSGIDPVVAIQENGIAYVLFGKSKLSNIDTVVECGGIRFWLNQMEIKALEIPELIKDNSEEMQMNWLKERGML